MKSSKKHSRNRIIKDSTPFAIKEAFNRLRTNIMYTPNNGKGAPVYAITSSAPSVGKSTVTANLALSFAQIGKKVLLIDADMRRPSQYRFFGLDKKSAGLSELLSGIEANDGDVIVKRQEDNLQIVTSGAIPPNPSALLLSLRLGELIEKWKGEYDIIFIDLPPTDVVSDPITIAKHVDGYIVVALANVSRANKVNACISTLEGVGAKIVGVVLNSTSLKGATGRKYARKKYGYGYYSYYGEN